MKPLRERWLLLCLSSLLAGGLAFAASCAFFPPLRELWGLGVDYGHLADAPFAGTGPFPHRLLGPLLAHLLQLDGDRFWLFSHGTMVLFLAVLFGAAIRRGCEPLGAMLLVLTLAATKSVAIYKGVVGYPDALSFTLLVLAALNVERSWRFWILLLLGLLNHEIAALFWPWLSWQRARTTAFSWRRDLLALAVLIAGYVAFHTIMHRGATGPGTTGAHWSLSYYLGNVGAVHDVLGMWILLAFFTATSFGVLPTLLFAHAALDGRWRAGVPTALFVGGVLATSLVAVDAWRFVGFLLVPLYFAGLRTLSLPRGRLVLLVLALLSLGAILSQDGIAARITEEMSPHYPHHVAAVYTHVLPKLWYVFAGYLLAVVAMAVAAGWIARSASTAAVDR